MASTPYLLALYVSLSSEPCRIKLKENPFFRASSFYLLMVALIKWDSKLDYCFRSQMSHNLYSQGKVFPKFSKKEHFSSMNSKENLQHIQILLKVGGPKIKFHSKSSTPRYDEMPHWNYHRKTYRTPSCSGWAKYKNLWVVFDSKKKIVRATIKINIRW